MKVKTQQLTGMRSKQSENVSGNGAGEQGVSATRESEAIVSPISERIIKETSVKRRKAMEMLANL